MTRGSDLRLVASWLAALAFVHASHAGGARAQVAAGGPDEPATELPADATVTTPQDDLALLDDSVARLADSARERARALLADKEYAGALAALEQARELDPRHAQTAIDLAELYVLLGNAPRAELTYRAALALDPEQPDVHLGLSDLLSREAGDAERLAEAASLLARARTLRGDDPAIVLRQARVAAAAGRFEDAERAYVAHLAQAAESDELRLEIGDFYRESGDADQALVWYRKVSSAQAPARIAAQRIFELDVEREARELGLSRKHEPISEQARALAHKSRLLASLGDLASAEQLVRRALALSPAFALARGDLGDVLRARGRLGEAELEYLRALAIDPAQAEVHLRLSELYLAAPENRRASEAALILERALRARPDLPALHLQLARAYQATGDLPRALLHASRFVAQAEPGEQRETAQALRRALERLLGEGERAQPNSMPALAGPDAGPLARARVHLARGSTDAALAELRRLPDVLRTTDVLNLEARVLHASGRLADAARVLRLSLERDPLQPEAHEELGLVWRALGSEGQARASFAQCAARGRVGCGFELARLDAGEDHGVLSFLYDGPRLYALLAARERLRGLRARGGSGLSARGAEIAALEARVDERLLALGLFALLVCGCVVALVLAVRARLWGGADVAALIAHSPDAGPEAMRIMSSIRHEVLKHNTMALSGVCEALRRGEPVAQKAAHLERALFGAQGEGGARDKLLAYAEQLRTLGRAHGLRLNLERRDPALAPLLSGFALLRRVRSSMRAADRLGPRARTKLLHALERAGSALHERGHAGVREALDRIRYHRVDVRALQRIFERTRAEPGFAHAQAVDLVLAEDAALPCRVGMPEAAFADVMTNLMRNALGATLAQAPRGAAGPGPNVLQVGLEVRSELDPVTAVEQIAFAVCDRAPGTPPEGALRGRYIEAGLGLTADLVARYEGSLEVQQAAPPWAKAIVLRLPGAAGADHRVEGAEARA